MDSRQSIALFSSWKVLVDVNVFDSLAQNLKYQLVPLHEFKTVLGFWRFWNSFGGESGLIGKLPQTCNVRMFRSCVDASNLNDPYIRLGGKWTVTCAKEDISRTFFMLLVQSASENLSENVVGVVLSQHEGNLTITIWTKKYEEKDEVSFKMVLGAFAEDLVYSKHDENAPTDEEPPRTEGPVKTIKIKEFKSYQNVDQAKIMPPSLEGFNWKIIYRQQDQDQPKEKKTALDRFFGEFRQYFDFEVVNKLNSARELLLNYEGCVVCSKPWQKTYNGRYMVLRCKLYHCQHVAMLDEVTDENVSNVSKNHCTSFFDVFRVEADDPSMSPIPREPLGTKRNCALRVQISHLLNNTPIVDLQCGQQKSLSSLRETRLGHEFLLVSFPDPTNETVVEAAKLAGNYVGPNYFTILRARLILSVKDGNMQHYHDANFDLTSNTSKGSSVKLRLVDQSTGNEVTVGLKRATVDGKDVTVIKFVRYVFGGKGSGDAAAPHIYVNIPSHAPMQMSPTAPQPLGSRDSAYLHDQASPYSDHAAPPSRKYTPRSTTASAVQSPHEQYDQIGGEMVHLEPHRLVCRTPPSPSDMYASPHHPSPSYNYGGYSPHTQSPHSQGRVDHRSMERDRRDPRSPPMHHYAGSRRDPRSPMHEDRGDRMGPRSPYSPSRGHMPREPMMDSPHSPHMYNMNSRTVTRRSRYDPFLGMESSFPPEDDGHIQQLIGRVVYLAKSESGSRFVQEKVGNARYLKIFFQEMKKRLPELMTDNFGHYAVETLFTHCSSNQRITLLQNLGPSLPNVACHKQGSFSVQSLINAVTSKEEIMLLKDYLQRELHRIILSCPGHYVILRFISRFGWPISNFVSDMLATNVVGFATDHYGLRVMKATFDSANPSAKLENLFKSVVEHTNSLAENQYGNYIIQHLFDIGSTAVTDEVKEKMKGRYVRYSKQKFSSNVVEKCLKHSCQEYDNHMNWTNQIVSELLGSSKELISDKYGNYCLQTALNTIQSDQKLVTQFIAAVDPHLESLRVNVRNKWIKLLNVPHRRLAGIGMQSKSPQV